MEAGTQGRALHLRGYQQRAIDDLRRALARQKRVILSAPTGSGKTEIAIGLILAAKSKGGRVLFICDLLTLVDQTSERLSAAGINHQIIQGQRKINWSARVFVASSQTLERRPWPINITLVIIDEAHSQRRRVLEDIEKHDLYAIGLTATPFSKGMSRTWQGIVTVTTTFQLMRDINPSTGQPYLCPVRVYRGKQIDESKLTLDSKGEYTNKSVTERTADIVGDVVPSWVKLSIQHFGGPRQTLVFTRTIKEGESICEEFVRSGYKFAQVTAHDDRDERKMLMERFRRGDLIGLVSCHALAKGLDVPAVSVMVDLNPLRKSLSLHIQKLGRIMRPAPGKSYGLVIDHVDNWRGFYDETIQFFQHGVDTLNSDLDETVRKPAEFRPKECFKCGLVLPPGAETCPGCNADVRSHKIMTTAPGKMVDEGMVNGKAQVEKDPWPHIVWMAKEKFSDEERARRWAKAQFKEMTGKYPRHRKFVAASEPDMKIANAAWGKYQHWLIRRRKQSEIQRGVHA